MSGIYAKYYVQFMLLPVYTVLQAEKFSPLTPFVFIFVELFRFVGEQIGFEVLVFGPAGPDFGPGRCTFLGILVF